MGGDDLFGSITSAQISLGWLLELRATEPAGNYPGGDLEVWNALASIPAVRNQKVQALVGDHVVVPGPRVAEGAEAIARALHSEAFE